MFSPYKKLAKLSLNRLRLSCISCRCIKFASRSAIESVNSANCGSNASSGKAPDCEELCALFCELRRDERDDGRRGVVGREIGERCGGRLRELDRGAGA